MRQSKNIPKNETKTQRFVRLASFRVNKLLKMYKQLGALGGVAYESTPDQRKKIETVLKDATERALAQMSKQVVVQEQFKL